MTIPEWSLMGISAASGRSLSVLQSAPLSAAAAPSELLPNKRAFAEKRPRLDHEVHFMIQIIPERTGTNENLQEREAS